jgi:HK97 family phage major capsid protein
MPTSRDRVTMPVITGGDDRYPGAVRATWVDEAPASSAAETNATFGQVSIPVHTLMASTPVSKNLLEDAQGALAIVGIVERQMADAFAITEDYAFLVGTGMGQPQGILKDTTTGGPHTFQYGSVTTINSGAATALSADAFRNTPYQLPIQYRDQGCAWLFSRGTARVIKTLKAGDGTYLWSGRSDTPQLAQGQPQALEGYPINETEVLAAPTTTNGTAYTANVYPVIFLARDAYQIIDRVGMDVQRYDDATTARQNQVVLVARRRVGGQVLEPWRVVVMKVAA